MSERTAEAEQSEAAAQLGRSALTPLLDVLFLLLFAVLATVERDAQAAEAEAQREREIDVRLPEVAQDVAAGAADDEERRRVELVVGADGSVTLHEDAEPTTLVDSPGELAQRLGPDPERLVVEVRADADARHAVVIDLLQTLWSEGVVDVRFVAAVDRGGEGESTLDRPFGGVQR